MMDIVQLQLLSGKCVHFLCTECKEKTGCDFYECGIVFHNSVQCRAGPAGLSVVAFFSGRIQNGLQKRAIQMFFFNSIF